MAEGGSRFSRGRLQSRELEGPSKWRLLYNKGEETREERNRRTVRVARVDLDGDSVPELIVQADTGGGAGAYYNVYRQEKGSHKLLEPANGYLQIEMWSRDGAGDYTRGLSRFDKGEYHTVRIDDYKGIQGTCVGTRAPK